MELLPHKDKNFDKIINMGQEEVYVKHDLDVAIEIFKLHCRYIDENFEKCFPSYELARMDNSISGLIRFIGLNGSF
jgi:prefoldin subunit 5